MRDSRKVKESDRAKGAFLIRSSRIIDRLEDVWRVHKRHVLEKLMASLEMRRDTLLMRRVETWRRRRGRGGKRKNATLNVGGSGEGRRDRDIKGKREVILKVGDNKVGTMVLWMDPDGMTQVIRDQ